MNATSVVKMTTATNAALVGGWLGHPHVKIQWDLNILISEPRYN
jgi:hypothetical protein